MKTVAVLAKSWALLELVDSEHRWYLPAGVRGVSVLITKEILDSREGIVDHTGHLPKNGQEHGAS